MNAELPSFLYKYRSINGKILYERQPDGSHKFVDNGLDALSQGKIWFSHLDKLNDPYENIYEFDDGEYFQNLELYLSTYPEATTEEEALQKNDLEVFVNAKKREGASERDIISLLEKRRTPSLKNDFDDIRKRICEYKKIKREY